MPTKNNANLQVFADKEISRTVFLPQCFSVLSKIFSRLLRCSTARGSNTRLSLVGPTKVMAYESFLITKGSLRDENKEHLVDFDVTIYRTRCGR